MCLSPKYKSGVSNYFESSKSSLISNNIPSHHHHTRFIYKRISVYDNATSDLLSHAPAIVSFLSMALHHGSVLVHCQRGISRSTTAVLFYLMGGSGLTLQEGIHLCKRRRPEVDPIPAFVGQLKIYETRCMEMGMIQSTNDSPGSDGRCDTNGRSRKRKAGGATIGPVRGPARGPTRPVRGPVRGPIGPARGPARGPIGPVRGPAIGPTKNPRNHVDDHSIGHIHKKSIIGACLPSPPSGDNGANDASCLLEEHKTGVECVIIGSQKKSLVPPLLYHLKNGEKADSSNELEDVDTNCSNDDVAEVKTIIIDSCET